MNSNRRAIIHTLMWTAVLLLLTNIGWSAWFAIHFGDAYRAQFINDMGGYPAAWPGLLASDGRWRIGVWRTEYEPNHVWFSHYETTTSWRAEPLEPGTAAALQSHTESVPGWVKPDRLDGLDRIEEKEVIHEMYVGVGYPVHILWCRWVFEGSADVVDRRTAIALSRRPPWVGTVERVLPYRPIWRGQLVYGGLCLAAVIVLRIVWHVLRHGRREFRQWRGLVRILQLRPPRQHDGRVPGVRESHTRRARDRRRWCGDVRTRRPSSWRRWCAITMLWSLLALLLTNAYWSWRFSQQFPTSYSEQWQEWMLTYPSDPFGYLAADDHYEITYSVPARTAADYPWIARFDTLTGPPLGSPEQRERFPELFAPQPNAVPDWVKPERLRHASRLGPGEYEREIFTAVGWPVRLLWCRWQKTGGGHAVDPWSAVVVNDVGPEQILAVAGVLPFRPVMSGQVALGAFWFAVACIVRLVCWAMRRGWRDRRSRLGRCANCNYDLRGNTSGVCPECGFKVHGDTA